MEKKTNESPYFHVRKSVYVPFQVLFGPPHWRNFMGGASLNFIGDKNLKAHFLFCQNLDPLSTAMTEFWGIGVLFVAVSTENGSQTLYFDRLYLSIFLCVLYGDASWMMRKTYGNLLVARSIFRYSYSLCWFSKLAVLLQEPSLAWGVG